jgi:hypothetical protein
MKGLVSWLRQLLHLPPPRGQRLPQHLADQQLEHDKAIRRATRAVAELRALEAIARKNKWT